VSSPHPEHDQDLVVGTLAERPDLADRINDFPDDDIAEFLYHDPVSVALFDGLLSRYPDHCVVVVDRAAPDKPVGKVCGMPFTWTGDPARDLPPRGYDAVLLSAAADLLAQRRGNMIAALLAIVQPARRGRGISHLMLDAMRRNAARLGYRSLVVPARPTRKHEHPDVSMAEYITWRRADDLPVDPWLRVHVRGGGRIVGVAPHSMTIVGTLDEWRTWTGLPFDASGPVRVPGALVPIDCDPATNLATYVEPNVWIHHPL
jgi:GNAT superfamily N-acetyltransferase